MVTLSFTRQITFVIVKPEFLVLECANVLFYHILLFAFFRSAGAMWNDGVVPQGCIVTLSLRMKPQKCKQSFSACIP